MVYQMNVLLHASIKGKWIEIKIITVLMFWSVRLKVNNMEFNALTKIPLK